jgi:parallel beta-helix repeat protein
VHGTTAIVGGSGIFVRDSSNVTVTGSDFSAIGSGIAHLNDVGLTFTNNNFHNLQTDGIYGGGSSKVLVSGNHFQDFFPQLGAHPDAIQFWGGTNGTQGSDVTITDNVIVRGSGDVIQGIFIESTNHVIISGNAMAGTMYNGISLSTSNDVLVADNFVQGFDDMGSRIITRGTSGNVVVENNTAQQVVTYNDGGQVNPNYVELNNTTIGSTAVNNLTQMNTWLSNHSDAADLSLVNSWIAQHGYTASNWIAL